MAYVDQTYYNNTYLGESVAEADFPRLSERASEIIDAITGHKITDISLLTDRTQQLVKKAVCCEIEYIDLMGGTVSGNMQSATLGKFSYSGSNSKASDSTLVNPRVYEYLAPTGLLYRGL